VNWSEPGRESGFLRVWAMGWGRVMGASGKLVQHDEATSHYASIVDHMGAGMRGVSD
jgi:hypothetical protein